MLLVPYTSEGDNFLLQQALPALAAVARAEGHEVKVVDCMPFTLDGDRSITKFETSNHTSLAAEKIMLSMQPKHYDSLNYVNKAAPEAVTVAGGGHFTNLAHRYANHPNIDVICIGEGEITFANILRAIESEEDDWENIDGIAFGRDGEMVKTRPAA